MACFIAIGNWYRWVPRNGVVPQQKLETWGVGFETKWQGEAGRVQ